MTCAIRLRAAVVLASILFAAAAVLSRPPQKEITVWALTETKIYHCPGSHWYKVGKGREMGECKAIREGYKAALASCGSNCR